GIRDRTVTGVQTCALPISPPSGGQCLPDLLDRFEFGRVKVRKASVDVRAGGTHLAIPMAALAVKGRGAQLAVSVSARGGSLELQIGRASCRERGWVFVVAA